MASLRSRLSWCLIGAMGIILLITGLALSMSISAWMAREFDQGLEAKARALVTLTEQENGAVEIDFGDEFTPEFETPENPEYFELWIGDGSLVERSHSFELNDETRRSSLPRSERLSAEPRFRDVRLPDGRWGRQIQIDFVPQVDDEEVEDGAEAPTMVHDPTKVTPESWLKVATLIFARERERLNARIRLVALTLGAAGVGLLAALALVTRATVRVGLRPLERLTRQVRSLDATSLESRVEVEAAPDEITPIVQQLNALLSRLKAAFKRERQLSQDIAHELKTPIAELRSLCDVGARWPEDRNATQHFFEDARTIALQMECTVTHLLALARYDEGSERVWKTRVCVAEVVDSAWKPLARAAAAKQIEFCREVSPALYFDTDVDKFRLIVSNLLSNAVTYSSPGSIIRCTSTEENGRACMRFINRAQNLAAEDLPVMFDRFWRKDEARTGGRNVGLGLSLVRAFADLLEIQIETRLETDNTFCITLTGPVWS